MNSQSIIVPKISTLPVHEPRARAIVRWLVRKNIIKEELTTCGRTGNRMTHAIAEAARDVVLHPEALPFGEQINGLDTKRIDWPSCTLARAMARRRSSAGAPSLRLA